MAPFQQDLLKILLDKLLLGVVAAGFGFYLAKLLENYRNKKSYDLFVWQQRIDACRAASRIITEDYFLMCEAFAGLKTAAEKGEMSIEDENAKKVLAHCDNLPMFRNELNALTPFLVPHVTQAAIAYLDETSRISDLIKGKNERGVPTNDELLMAYSKFQDACAAIIDAGPRWNPSNSMRS